MLILTRRFSRLVKFHGSTVSGQKTQLSYGWAEWAFYRSETLLWGDLPRGN